MGITKKLGLWVPEQLDQKQLETRIMSCETLLVRFLREPINDRVVIGELWVWWDQHGVIHYKIFHSEEIVNTDRYQQQMTDLSNALKDNRPRITDIDEKVLLHCNPMLRLVQEAIESLGWEIFTIDPYSPDLCPLQYFFAKMKKTFEKKRFTTHKEVREYIDDFIISHPQKFYWIAIYNLTTNWQRCINENGNYIL